MRTYYIRRTRADSRSMI